MKCIVYRYFDQMFQSTEVQLRDGVLQLGDEKIIYLRCNGNRMF